MRVLGQEIYRGGRQTPPPPACLGLKAKCSTQSIKYKAKISTNDLKLSIKI